MALAFPDIDPVLLSVGPLEVRWYALAYIAGLLLGWWLIGRLNRTPPSPFSQRAYDDVLLWLVGGVLIGGRLGYVLLYNWPYFSVHPEKILFVWEGGMSFHGGLLGVIVATWWMCRVHRMSFWAVADLLAVAAPIGIFFGRMANFINAELVGRVSDVPWAMVFPGYALPRHPSQLYQAATEGLLLFVVLALLAFYSAARRYPGLLAGVFLLGYGLARIAMEQFREPDAHLGFVADLFTRGQLYSAPMLLIGLWCVWCAWRARRPLA